MVFKNYYKILDLETSHVSIDEVKVAYRQAAKKYHPDLNIGDKLAEEKIKDINEAYKVLSETASRRKYDRMWYNHIGKRQKVKYEESSREKGSVFSDFFNMFFGETSRSNSNSQKEDKAAKKVASKGENIETEMNVSITEAFYGNEKKSARKRFG